MATSAMWALGNGAYEYSVTMTGAGSSDSILVPTGVSTITITIEGTSGGTGSVYTTTDTIETVTNGSPTWEEWEAGQVVGPLSGVFYPVTAFKMYQAVNGTTKMTARAQ